MKRADLLIVTPALRDANNGNWQTAQRWARLLAADYRVHLLREWRGPEDGTGDALIALHARRSAASLAAWAAQRPVAPRVLALTGTDLYRDIATDAAAQRSLALADRLLVLQEQAPRNVPAEHRAKCVVCFQSCSPRQPLPKTAQHLRALMVGHLRDEKWPQTFWAAAALLDRRPDIRLDHAGAALDPALGDAARACAHAHPAYRWLGPLDHGAARARIQRAHVLVHPSRMEGGAHVVMEAITSGTPVLASRIPGNVGLLGEGYDGYFEPGDAAGLAALLARCRDDPAILPNLTAQCDRRAPLFSPEREAATLRTMLADLLETRR